MKQVQKTKQNAYMKEYRKKKRSMKVGRENLTKTILVLNVRLKNRVLPVTTVKTVNVRLKNKVLPLATVKTVNVRLKNKVLPLTTIRSLNVTLKNKLMVA